MKKVQLPSTLRIGLANRMVLGVAQQVRRFLTTVFEATVFDVEATTGPLDVLVVGWRHIDDDLNESFGYAVLNGLVAKHRPSLVVYVVPSELSPGRYRRDLAALRAASSEVCVTVLEVPRLATSTAAILRAQQVVRTVERNAVVSLLA